MEVIMEAKVEVEILKLIREVSKKQDALTTTLSEHVNKEEGDWTAMKGTLSQLCGAFPDQDLVGHRNYHESLIERNKWITQICKRSVEELAKYGLLGFIVWLGYQAWTGFLAGPK